MLGEYIGTGVTILAYLTGIAISWGYLQGRISALEEHVRDLRKVDEAIEERHDRLSDQYVHINHFKAITEPVQENIRTIQKDIKQILMILSHNESHRRNQKIPEL